MSEPKHTTGPWSVWTPRGPDYRDRRCYILGPVPADERELAPTVADVPMSTENREANARLIAAAPDLLQALIACLEWVEAGSDAWDLADAAIAKATGGDDA